MGAMNPPGARPDPDDHTRCRHFVWTLLPEDDTAVPGSLCENEFGVFSDLDCPVFLGLSCTLFEPRAAGEEPTPVGPDEIRRLKSRLAEDYLRWPYFRRVAGLGPPEGAEGGRPRAAGAEHRRELRAREARRFTRRRFRPHPPGH
jgi:hypothetical protein